MRTRWDGVRGDASGFTLVELLVASLLLGVLGAIGTSMLLASKRSADVSIGAHQSVEEARLAINRVSRELRQATSIAYVQNPDGAARDDNAVTVVSFEADFNGDGCAASTNLEDPTATCPATNPSDPEQLTYCHEPPAVSSDAGRLYIVGGPVTATVTDCTSLGGLPILASGVDRFSVSYRSSLYRYDLAPADGTTTWTELDAALAPVGNANATLDGELPHIDRVVIDMTLDGGTERKYRTSVTLRNKS